MKIEDSPNFNCGHNSGKKIKPVYIRKFLRITHTYESDLKEIFKMNFDPDSSITIRRENVDGDFLYVGRVAEFQNITAYEETFEETHAQCW